MGERANLAEMIHRITGIDESLLRNNNADSISSNLRGCSVHTKMVWASGRITTRMEDRAYSLMGLFNINMPLLYGEGGGRAFTRLQEEIIKRTNDQSILLHGAGVFGDHLAASPNDFKPYDKFLKSLICHNLPFQKTRGGVDVSLGLYPTQSSRSFWGIIEAYFSDDPLQLDRPAIRLGWSGRDGKYQREDLTIYRVRPGDEGQMEVVGETGESVGSLRGSVRREVVQLSHNNVWRTVWEARELRILLRPIVHKSVWSRYEYNILCPQAHRNFIYVRSPRERIRELGDQQLGWEDTSPLLACVLLRNVGPNPGSPNLAILIFWSGFIHLHLVDIQSWLGEKGTEAVMNTLPSVAARLSSLPIVTTKYQTPSFDQVAHCITELGLKYNQAAGTSIVMSNGVRVKAWISEGDFLESRVYHLHVTVDQENGNPIGEYEE
ncbi:hypothetical protein F4824DRAFT_435756 [Ustulina deusta]|nr:hypothetical protein F4824DRAFT_435756 [Ustulina deusta]